MLGENVALVLVVAELIAIAIFLWGKITKGQIITASVPIIFLAAFFWSYDRISEMSVANVGTIKLAADQATQYVQEIKNIKIAIDKQKTDIDGVAAKAANTDKIIDDLESKNDKASEQLSHIAEQLAKAQNLAEKLRQQQDYSEVARLTALGLTGLVTPNALIVEHSKLNDLIGSYVQLQPKLRVECTKEAMAAYDAAIKLNDRFPYTYYYKGTCERANNLPGGDEDIQKAKAIFLITVTIPGHHINHDECLKIIQENGPIQTDMTPNLQSLGKEK